MTTGNSTFAFPTRFGPLLDEGEEAGGGAAPAKEAAKETPAGGPDLAAELATAKRQIQEGEAARLKLETFKKNSVAVLRDDTPVGDRVKAYREILADQGVTGQQAEVLIQQVFKGEKVEQTNTPSPEKTPDDAVRALRDDMNRQRLRVIKTEIDSSTKAAMASKEATEFGEVMLRLHGEVEAKKLMESIEAEVKATTINLLGDRKNDNNGQFDEDWIGPESTNALKSVVGRLRAVIGDASKIGRTPETATGLESLVKKQPVPAPQYKKGMGMSGATDAFSEYAVDRLARGAAGMDSGQSRV